MSSLKEKEKKKKRKRNIIIYISIETPPIFANSVCIIDPNAPKRGLSAYMFYAQDHREQVKRDNPDITFGQIGKVLGEQWKAMSDKEKVPYEAKAARDKQRYEQEKASYSV